MIIFKHDLHPSFVWDTLGVEEGSKRLLLIETGTFIHKDKTVEETTARLSEFDILAALTTQDLYADTAYEIGEKLVALYGGALHQTPTIRQPKNPNVPRWTLTYWIKEPAQ